MMTFRFSLIGMVALAGTFLAAQSVTDQSTREGTEQQTQTPDMEAGKTGQDTGILPLDISSRERLQNADGRTEDAGTRQAAETELLRKDGARPRNSQRQTMEPGEGVLIAKPASPTEFQIFVQQATGKLLPIYGQSLFNNVPSTFAPIDHAPVSADYTLGPGDQIQLRIWGQVNANDRLTVDRAGNIFVPQVGRINVSGVKFDQLQSVLRTNIERVFRNFELSVEMGELRSIDVFVTGFVKRPGTYTVSSLSTLVNALFACGGPAAQGSMRAIEVRRHGATITKFDLYDLLARGDNTHDAGLQPGDVIFVPPAGKRVALGGSVTTAAVYEFKDGESLGDLLTIAGGLSPVAAGQHAVLQRIDSRAALESKNIQLNRDGLATALSDGDIVTLLQVVPKFENTVSVKGNVADAYRLPWHAGMKLSEAIPDREALLTRGYWSERNRLNAGTGSYVEEATDRGGDRSYAASVTGGKSFNMRQFNSSNAIQPPAPDINWAYASIERTDPDTLSMHVIPVHLDRVVLDHDPQADVELMAGDIVTIYSTADFVTPQVGQTRYVRLEGEIKMAGVYSVKPGETLRDLIARAGGLTDKAYVYGSEFTRVSTRREQEQRLSQYVDQVERDMDQSMSSLSARTMSADSEMAMRQSLLEQKTALERLRQEHATGRIVLNLQPDDNGVNAFPALALENGDRLIVPAIPSTASVVGTVYNQSTFLLHSDTRVKDCLEEAGGPTKFADKSHIFVIRADGSIVTRAKDKKLEALNIYPGDTVVVPTNSMKFSRLRSLTDISQMMGGLGLSATAVNAIK